MDGGAQQRMREPDRVVVPLAGPRSTSSSLARVGRVDGDRGERRRERQRVPSSSTATAKASACASAVHRAEPAQHRSPERPRGGRRRRGEVHRRPSALPDPASAASSSRIWSGLPSGELEATAGRRRRRHPGRRGGRACRRPSARAARATGSVERRIGGQGREQPAGPRLARPGRDDDRDRLVGDAADADRSASRREGSSAQCASSTSTSGGRALRDAQQRPSAAHAGPRTGRVRRARRGVPGIPRRRGRGGRTG